MDGLKGDDRTKLALQAALMRFKGVKSAAASTLTGNLTVTFAKETSSSEILEHIDSSLDLKNGSGQSDAAWETLEAEDVARRLGVSPKDGLSYKKASDRLKKYGRNELVLAPPRSTFSILFEQVSSPPAAILFGAGVYSLCIGAAIEAIAIGAVLAINAAIGYVTVSKAEASTAKLLRTGAPTVKVLRQGHWTEIDGSVLVPGDVIHLERGDLVPADGRLHEAHNLFVNEAALTGESLPVPKDTRPLGRNETPLAERTNMVYRGTIAASGSGKAIVVATGPATEIGKVQAIVSASRAPATPAEVQLTHLGRRLTLASLGAALLLMVIGGLRGIGLYPLFRSAFSLAVAAIPEGLPLTATVTHALSGEAMHAQNIFVRRSDALETLACVDIVCLDKTGTLTENRMSMAAMACGDEVIDWGGLIDGGARRPATQSAAAKLLEVAALCNEIDINGHESAEAVGGSATETAFIQAASDFGIDVRRLAVDNEKHWVRQWFNGARFMLSCHTTAQGPMLAMKGEPLEVLRRCTSEHGPAGDPVGLSDERRRKIEDQNVQMASEGLRVLGFAYADRAPRDDDEKGAADGMTWLGLAALTDPIRPDAQAAIGHLKEAGIRPIILTGDQFLTARAVAKKIGFEEPSSIVEAGLFEDLDLPELAAAARKANVFARITPEQKLRVVEALQRSGSVVAMVGDGINDSPALRKADVGIALSMRADAAARDVADIVVASSDLGSIATAICHGRASYENIRKAIRFLLATNGSEVLLMLAQTAAGFAEALSPIQLLWINLITDVAPGVGLAMQAPDADVMSRKPEPRSTPLLGKAETIDLLGDSALLAGTSIAAGLYGAARYGISSPTTRTLTFGSLITSQLQYASACRKRSTMGTNRAAPNKALNLILTASAAVQISMMTVPPLRRLLGLAPLSALDAAIMVAAGLLPGVVRHVAPRSGPMFTARHTTDSEKPEAKDAASNPFEFRRKRAFQRGL